MSLSVCPFARWAHLLSECTVSERSVVCHEPPRGHAVVRMQPLAQSELPRGHDLTIHEPPRGHAVVRMQSLAQSELPRGHAVVGEGVVELHRQLPRGRGHEPPRGHAVVRMQPHLSRNLNYRVHRSCVHSTNMWTLPRPATRRSRCGKCIRVPRIGN